MILKPENSDRENGTQKKSKMSAEKKFIHIHYTAEIQKPEK